MNKLIVCAAVLMSSYSFCMESGHKGGGVFSEDEKSVAQSLMELNSFIREISKASKGEKLFYGPHSPKRNSYKAVPPNIKQQHGEAIRKAKTEKWSLEKMKTLRKCLFPGDLQSEISDTKSEVIIVD
jgi:hypothetical protein